MILDFGDAVPGAGGLFHGDAGEFVAQILRVGVANRGFRFLCQVEKCKRMPLSFDLLVRHLRNDHKMEGRLVWQRI